MIYTKVSCLSLNISIFYLAISNSWTCLKPSNGTAQPMQSNTRRSLRRNGPTNFLLGLNKNMDEVRGRILGTKPLPNIREVALEVRQEESRKKVMVGSQTNQPLTEGSTLVTRGPLNLSNDNRPRKGRLWCDHC